MLRELKAQKSTSCCSHWMPEINILICIWRRNFSPQCHSNFRMSLPLILVWHISGEWRAPPVRLFAALVGKRNKRRSSFVRNISAGMCDSLFYLILVFCVRPANSHETLARPIFFLGCIGPFRMKNLLCARRAPELLQMVNDIALHHHMR